VWMIVGWSGGRVGCVAGFGRWWVDCCVLRRVESPWLWCEVLVVSSLVARIGERFGRCRLGWFGSLVEDVSC